MKFQFLSENFSRSENAPPFETRKIRHFEVERIFLENKKMVQEKVRDVSGNHIDGRAVLVSRIPAGKGKAALLSGEKGS